MQSAVKFIVLGCCFVLLNGCLSACAPLQTHQLQSNETIARLPTSKKLNVPFIKQRHRHCGPATMAMLLQFYGRKALQTDIAEAVFDEAKLGTFQTDMVAYLRTQHFLPYQLPSHLVDVMHAVADGYPVIVMQNLGFNGVGKVLAKWHYAVIVGYDLETQHMILHSGAFEYYRLPFKTFERTWARSDYWALTAWPIEQDVNTPWLNPNQYLNALIDMDELHSLPDPIQSYLNFVTSHPNYPRAWFRLGNHQYPHDAQASLHSFVQAIRYDEAIVPTHWNNLAFVANQQGCQALAKEAIVCALARTPHFKPALDTQKTINATLNGQMPVDSAPNCPKVTCMNAPKSAIILQ